MNYLILSRYEQFGIFLTLVPEECKFCIFKLIIIPFEIKINIIQLKAQNLH